MKICRLTLLIIIFLLIGIIITFAPSRKHSVVNEPTPKNTIYTLKDYNGQIALFIDKSKNPIEIYNIYTNSLPKEDSKKLKNGIKAENQEDLNKLLEDYLG